DPTDPIPFDPSDVDLYHFSIREPGQYAFTAEVFARRLGSSLDPAATLFRLDPRTGRLVFVSRNDNTGQTTPPVDNSSVPLFSDAVVYAGLSAGEYYLAVSSGENVPDPALGLLPGADGIYDPAVSHSGALGNSTGEYVLNLQLAQDNEPPQVIDV